MFVEKIMSNLNYYCSNNDLGLIYLLSKNFNNIEQAEKNLKEAGLNEYQCGQNNLGLYYQFYLKMIGNAEYLFGIAAKNQFALAEFNLAYIFENDKKINQSIEHYVKASEYEYNEIIFRNQVIEDEQLEISKSFIICYTNFKLSQFFIDNDKDKSNKLFIRAIFGPLFYLLIYFRNESYSFKFSTVVDGDNYKIINLQQFILNNPMFNIFSNNFSSNGWIKNEKIDQNICEISLSLNLIKSEQKSKFNTTNEEFSQINSSYEVDKNFCKLFKNELIDIFNSFNKRNMFEIIHDQHFQKEYGQEVLIFCSKRNNTKLILKFNEKLCEIFIKNQNEMIFYINKIMCDMHDLIYTPPYSILFCRTNIYSRNQFHTQQTHSINQEFYDGFYSCIE